MDQVNRQKTPVRVIDLVILEIAVAPGKKKSRGGKGSYLAGAARWTKIEMYGIRDKSGLGPQ